MFLNNPSIKKSQLRSKIISQNGIDFLIEFLTIDNLTKKPLNVLKAPNQEVNRVKDVFEPPFEEGILFDDDFMNLGNHRVVFNKFPVKDNHLVLVSRSSKSQFTHLDLYEISELILLQNLINGIVFFNGGKNSGASQPRKHIQVIPFENISNDEFGIFKIYNRNKKEFFNNIVKIDLEKNHIINNHREYYLKEQRKDKTNSFNLNLTYYFEVLKIKQFEENGIEHLFVDLSKLKNYFNEESYETILTQNFEEYSKIVFIIYLNVLKNLKLINYNTLKNEACDIYNHFENDLEKIFYDYSLLYTQDWLFIIPRKSDRVKLQNGSLFLNSNSYTFSLLIKSEELENEIERIDIIKDIYTKL